MSTAYRTFKTVAHNLQAPYSNQFCRQLNLNKHILRTFKQYDGLTEHPAIALNNIKAVNVLT